MKDIDGRLLLPSPSDLYVVQLSDSWVNDSGATFQTSLLSSSFVFINLCLVDGRLISINSSLIGGKLGVSVSFNSCHLVVELSLSCFLSSLGLFSLLSGFGLLCSGLISLSTHFLSAVASSLGEAHVFIGFTIITGVSEHLSFFLILTGLILAFGGLRLKLLCAVVIVPDSLLSHLSLGLESLLISSSLSSGIFFSLNFFLLGAAFVTLELLHLGSLGGNFVISSLLSGNFSSNSTGIVVGVGNPLALTGNLHLVEEANTASFEGLFLESQLEPGLALFTRASSQESGGYSGEGKGNIVETAFMVEDLNTDSLEAVLFGNLEFVVSLGPVSISSAFALDVRFPLIIAVKRNLDLEVHFVVLGVHMHADVNSSEIEVELTVGNKLFWLNKLEVKSVLPVGLNNIVAHALS